MAARGAHSVERDRMDDYLSMSGSGWNSRNKGGMMGYQSLNMTRISPFTVEDRSEEIKEEAAK
jgi:hypothetical protein